MYNSQIRLSTAAAFVGASVFALSAAASKAAILASESFDYALGGIAGLNGGTGFSGAYTGAGSVTAPGQTYPGLTTAGNTFTTAGNNNGAFRTLAATIGTDSGTIYVRFLGSNTAGGAPEYAGLSFFSGGNEELFFGKPFNATNYGFEVSGVSGQVTAPSATISAATTLLVYRLSFTPAGDTIDLFVNPGSTLPLTPDASFTTPVDDSAFPSDFTGIRLQSGTNAPTFDYDEIMIATTEAEVLVIPEPSSIGLLGVAAAGLVIRRRRA